MLLVLPPQIPQLRVLYCTALLCIPWAFLLRCAGCAFAVLGACSPIYVPHLAALRSDHRCCHCTRQGPTTATTPYQCICPPEK
ncbi:hypothetical protein F5884DRAFT_791008 [Xylogone sp. PMI_703]|nr:hypothetical protein F5884DRAFT_791008 [Xylogone sp. PMI_703]